MIRNSKQIIMLQRQQLGASINSSGSARSFTSALPNCQAMKPGETMDNLNVFKGKDPPVVLKREEYPDWVGELVNPPKTLAALRRIPNEEATEDEMKRYLKLTRRLDIKAKNQESAT